MLILVHSDHTTRLLLPRQKNDLPSKSLRSNPPLKFSRTNRRPLLLYMKNGGTLRRPIFRPLHKGKPDKPAERPDPPAVLGFYCDSGISRVGFPIQVSSIIKSVEDCVYDQEHNKPRKYSGEFTLSRKSCGVIISGSMVISSK